MKYDIFISYSRKNSAIVNEFVRLMEDEGYRVWIDRDGIESGDAFKKVIVRAIKESALIVFFSSESSNASPWTVKEINVAVHHEKTIIPVKLDKTVYNEEVEFDLVSLDYIDYTDAATHELMKGKLLRTLRSRLPERWEEIRVLKEEEARKRKDFDEERTDGEQFAKVKAEPATAEPADGIKVERERTSNNTTETLNQNVGEKPKSYKVLSLISLLFCWILSIPAIIYAFRVEKLWKNGCFEEAKKASIKAKRWGVASIIVGVILYIIYL